LALSLGTIHLADIDLKTILALLTLMITIAIYEKLHLLRYIANVIIEKCQSIRAIIMVILLFSFFGAMLFTNDVAILTLIPIVFNIRKQVKLPTIGLVSLMTVYANLGSAMTPFGNPQNLVSGVLFSFGYLGFFKAVATDWL
jgi:Na+/H+ antiporter NhaD/arsenite permease-like protein